MSYLLCLLVLSSCIGQGFRIALESLGKSCRLVSIYSTDEVTIRPLDAGEDSAESCMGTGVSIGVEASGLTASSGKPETKTAKAFRIQAGSGGILTLSSSGKPVRRYRGALEIRFVDSPSPRIAVVNEIDLESYLTSVVPAEMPSGYREEALKAQAVAARTYAVSHRKGHPSEQADLCDGVHCQLYLGVDSERPTTNAAVEATRGEIAQYQGKPIAAYYSGDCGGATTIPTGKVPPYLAVVKDLAEGAPADYCSAGRNHAWAFTLSADQLKIPLARIGKGEVGELKEVTIVEADESGRARMICIQGADKEITLTGEEFRRLFGYSKVPSTRFVITKKEQEGWLFQGSGSGHGIGMCQEGANGLAGPPYNLSYTNILKHYYQGIEIENIPK